MKDKTIDTFPEKRRRGRPPTGTAKTNAERQKRYRERQKLNPKIPDSAEVLKLKRRIRTLERNAAETARLHKEVMDGLKELVNRMDAKCAHLEAELKKLKPDQGGK